MIKSLDIQGYRCFERLEVPDLARVNLFVGRNNAGKTALLDAVDLFVYRASFESIVRSADRRREALQADAGGDSGNWDAVAIYLAHSLHGRALSAGRVMAIRAHTPHGDSWLKLVLSKSERGGIKFDWSSDAGDAESGDIAPSGRVTSTLHRFREYSGPPWLWEDLHPDSSLTRYVSQRGDDLSEVASAWNDLLLSPEEDLVLKSLRILEPDLERLAFIPEPMGLGSFAARLRNVELRVPLGSLGDGMRQMLSVILQLVRAKGGMLLVDEIDTGLHYSVMPALWRLVLETARRLDVQVFATTHSRDCLEGIAALSPDELKDDLAVYRLERGNPKAVRYAGAEMAIAAEASIEVR